MATRFYVQFIWAVLLLGISAGHVHGDASVMPKYRPITRGPMATETPLAKDSRLQRTMSFNAREPKLDEMLGLLREATGLRFEASDGIARDT